MFKTIGMSKRIFLIIVLSVIIFTVSCDISIGTTTDDKDFTEYVKKIEKLMETSELLYPAKNTEYSYTVYEDYVVITKYVGEEETITIPAEIEEKPVFSIAHKAFEKSKVTNVTISEGIYIVGESCFENSALEAIILPESLFEIGEDAFSNCQALKEISFPASVSVIPSSVCYECDSLRKVTILSTSEKSEIEDMAFIRCGALEEVHVSSAISYISSTAFSGIPENTVFFSTAGSETAKYCAQNYKDFVVVEEEETTEIEETTEKLEEETSDDSETEEPSLLGLIIVCLIFFGILAGVIVLLVLRRKGR